MSPLTAVVEELLRLAAMMWLFPSLKIGIVESVLLLMDLRGW